MTAPLIRPVALSDHSQWAQLYQGYADFYGVAQSDAMRATVWQWLHDPDHAVNGLVAEGITGLCGIAHFRPFARPLSASTGGFMDDLFVAPEARRTGAGQALIEAVAELGRKKGWTVIRWITADDNAPARAVYDRVAAKTAWVTYDIRL